MRTIGFIIIVGCFSSPTLFAKGWEKVWLGAQGDHYFEVFVERASVAGCELSDIDRVKDTHGYRDENCKAVGYNAKFSSGTFGMGARTCKGSAKYVCSPFLRYHSSNPEYFPQKRIAFEHNSEPVKFFINPATVEARAYEAIFEGIGKKLSQVEIEVNEKRKELLMKKLELSKVNLQIDAIKERLGDEYQ